jgi:hypothetical protein
MGEGSSAEELRTLTKKFAPHLVCISCTMSERLPAAIETIAALRADSSDLEYSPAAKRLFGMLLRCFGQAATRSAEAGKRLVARSVSSRFVAPGVDRSIDRLRLKIETLKVPIKLKIKVV